MGVFVCRREDMRLRRGGAATERPWPAEKADFPLAEAAAMGKGSFVPLPPDSRRWRSLLPRRTQHDAMENSIGGDCCPTVGGERRGLALRQRRLRRRIFGGPRFRFRIGPRRRFRSGRRLSQPSADQHGLEGLRLLPTPIPGGTVVSLLALRPALPDARTDQRSVFRPAGVRQPVDQPVLYASPRTGRSSTDADADASPTAQEVISRRLRLCEPAWPQAAQLIGSGIRRAV